MCRMCGTVTTLGSHKSLSHDSGLKYVNAHYVIMCDIYPNNIDIGVVICS